MMRFAPTARANNTTYQWNEFFEITLLVGIPDYAYLEWDIEDSVFHLKGSNHKIGAPELQLRLDYMGAVNRLVHFYLDETILEENGIDPVEFIQDAERDGWELVERNVSWFSRPR